MVLHRPVELARLFGMWGGAQRLNKAILYNATIMFSVCKNDRKYRNREHNSPKN